MWKKTTILAINVNDPYPRDWNIQQNNENIITEIHSNGQQMTLWLPPGTYQLLIGQSGGTAYGAYLGFIGKVPFEGADNTHPITFTVN